MGRLGEEKENDEHLDENPDDTAEIVFPTGVSYSNWVNELVEKSSRTAEPLEHSDPFGSDVEREQLDEERVCQCVEGHVVGRTIEEDKPIEVVSEIALLEE